MKVSISGTDYQELLLHPGTRVQAILHEESLIKAELNTSASLLDYDVDATDNDGDASMNENDASSVDDANFDRDVDSTAVDAYVGNVETPNIDLHLETDVQLYDIDHNNVLQMNESVVKQEADSVPFEGAEHVSSMTSAEDLNIQIDDSPTEASISVCEKILPHKETEELKEGPSIAEVNDAPITETEDPKEHAPVAEVNDAPVTETEDLNEDPPVAEVNDAPDTETEGRLSAPILEIGTGLIADDCSVPPRIRSSLRQKRKSKPYSEELFDNPTKSPPVMKRRKEPNQKSQANKRPSFQCDKCELSYHKLKYLKHHKVEKHDKVRYPCNQCDYAATRPSTLKAHQQSIHEGKRYPCTLCKRQFVFHSDVTRHMKTVHSGGSKLECDQCSYITARPNLLRRHIESVHTKATYACDECDYVATYPSDLRPHKLSKHAGVRYACDKCNYFATRKANLMRHQKSVH